MIARTQLFAKTLALGLLIGVGSNASASEFDPKTGELVAPEMIVVREDPQGNRTVLTLDKAPMAIETEAEKQRVAESAEAIGNAVKTEEGGAEGSGPKPKEFDKVSGTPAWYYWYYPTYNNHYSYNCYYTYGSYYYRPVTYYNYGYYNYFYYRRW